MGKVVEELESEPSILGSADWQLEGLFIFHYVVIQSRYSFL